MNRAIRLALLLGLATLLLPACKKQPPTTSGDVDEEEEEDDDDDDEDWEPEYEPDEPDYPAPRT